MVQTKKLGILGALVNAPGDERDTEWVSIYNFSEDQVDLTGWKLQDRSRRSRELKGSLNAGEILKVKDLDRSTNWSGMSLGNRQGDIYIVDSAGETVDEVSYKHSVENKIVEGVPIYFMKGPNSTGVEIVCTMLNANPTYNLVTLYNFGSSAVDLKGWTLNDFKGEPMKISGIIEPGQSITFKDARDSKTGLSNHFGSQSGKMILYNDKANSVSGIEYTEKFAPEKGIIATFGIAEEDSNVKVVEDKFVQAAVVESGVLILSAMINAEGNELENEWISITNVTSSDIDLEGWSLSDGQRKPRVLSGKLPKNSILKVTDLSGSYGVDGLTLKNRGGVIKLLNNQGTLVDAVTYARNKGTIREGEAHVFRVKTLGKLPDNDVDSGVVILGAMIDAQGNEEKGKEWIRIVNVSESEIDLTGWALTDGQESPNRIKGSLKPGEVGQVGKLNSLLNSKHGLIKLVNKTGTTVDEVKYTKDRHTIVEDRMVTFHE